MSNIHKYLLFGICLIWALQAAGQAARTPFSSFGIGEPYGNALVNSQGMAGVGVSQPQFGYINNQNPALLVYNWINTSFQAGIIMERRTLSGDTSSEKSQGGNMNYLVTAFPIKPNKWTTSVGLMPFTTVNYQLQYNDEIAGSTDDVTVLEDGSGGLTQLYWSNGVRLTQDLTVGAKASYIFSSIVNSYSNQVNNSGQPINYVAGVEEKSYVRDFTFGTGISFSKDSLFNRQRYRLSVGAVYNFATDLNTRKTDKLFRLNGEDTLDVDVLPTSLRGKISIPASFTVGISLSRGIRWSIGTEFSYQDWSTYRSIIGQNQGLRQAWRAAVGGELTPDLYDPQNYLKRVTYRAGVSMEESPFLANGNPVKDVGINFGFTLPAGRYNSLDVAFKYGKRGDRKENTLEESYFKIYFGITFNDQWFIKRRFD